MSNTEVEGKTYEVVEQTLSAIPVAGIWRRIRAAVQRFRDINDEVIAAALRPSMQLRFKVLMGLTTTLGPRRFCGSATHVLTARDARRHPGVSGVPRVVVWAPGNFDVHVVDDPARRPAPNGARSARHKKEIEDGERAS